MPDKESLSLDYQQVLRDQVIDGNGPGTILKDFEIVLNFIGTDGVAVSGKYNLFPLNVLSELNARLSHPIEIDLKRPQQKSYPNIHGLYLLLRAAGLGLVRKSGKSQRLVLDREMLKSWKALNSTEHYFSLLETWMLRGNPGIIGERMNLFHSWIPECMRFCEWIPSNGMLIEGNRYGHNHIVYCIGLFGFALMELFGFISLEQLKPEKGKGWRIASVHRTAFGDALLQLLVEEYYDDIDRFLGYPDETDDTTGALQPVITSLFPEWKKNLTIPEHVFRDGTYVFKVFLGARCWRRIAMSGEAPLQQLGTTILNAFEFDHEHLDMFTYTNRFGVRTKIYNPHVSDEPLYTNEVLIGDISLEPGSCMTYLYDFGDNWEFDVELERIDPVDPKIKTPVVIESRGEAPEQYSSWDEWE